MKTLLFFALLLGFNGIASAETELTCEIRCAVVSGPEPSRETKELLIENTANLKVNTGKISLFEGKPSLVDKSEPYRYPVAFEADGKIGKYATERLGLNGRITLLQITGDSVKLQFEINKIELAGSMIYANEKNQFIMPAFSRFGIGPEGEITQTIGQGWFFLPLPWKEKESNQLWAFRVDKK